MRALLAVAFVLLFAASAVGSPTGNPSDPSRFVGGEVAVWTMDASSRAPPLVLDVSGNGNDLQTDYAFGQGAFGDALLAGPSGSAYAANSPSIQSLGHDFTILFWIRTTDATAYDPWYYNHILVDHDVANYGQPDWDTYIRAGHIGFMTGNENGGDDLLLSTQAINDDTWHAVMITRVQATGEKRIIIDGGVPDSQISTTRNLENAVGIHVGNAPDSRLDEVRLYNVTLDAATGFSILSAPYEAPTVPAPELPTMILAAFGLVAVVGFVALRRR